MKTLMSSVVHQVEIEKLLLKWLLRLLAVIIELRYKIFTQLNFVYLGKKIPFTGFIDLDFSLWELTFLQAAIARLEALENDNAGVETVEINDDDEASLDDDDDGTLFLPSYFYVLRY